MSEGETGEVRRHPSTIRIEAFSDGVIAIVATIMVLELHEPALTFVSGSFWAVLAELGPDISVYGLSFLMVAILLVNHHNIIRVAPHASVPLYWCNANFLFWMALIPLSTSVYGKHPLTALAAAFYGAVLLANTLSLVMLRRCVLDMNRGAAAASRRPLARRAFNRDLMFAVFYAASIPLAYVSEYISMAIFIAIPVAHLLPMLGASEE